MTCDKPVLVVDDFGETARFLGQMFDHLHIATDSAKSPEDAIARVSETKYQLVIADSRMPKVNGVSLLKQIRAKSPETKVVVMSTFDSGTTSRLAASQDIDYYLPKPVKLEHLEKMIKDLALKF